MKDTHDVISKILVEWHEFALPTPSPRAVDYPLVDENRIVAVIGPRRAGKTWSCYQMIHRLLNRGVPRNNIVYVSFEDERLTPLDGSELSELLSTQAEMYAPHAAQPRYCFLDEIHNVPRWSQWVRRAADQNPDLHIVITGSSSRLLSSEIATELRGRSATVTVYPYSFSEFAAACGVDTSGVREDLLRSERRTTIKRCFNDYALRGGFPDVAGRERYRDTLQQYYRTMFTRDMVERFGIRNVRQFEDFLRIQMSRFSSLSSISNTEKAMRELGYSLSKNTLMNYLRYVNDAFLLFDVTRFDTRVTRQLRHPRKLYAVDHGLLNAIRFSTSEDRGRILENMAYMELRRRHPDIYYHAGAAECDFLILSDRHVSECIQTCWSLSDPRTAEREYRGLLEAAAAHGLREGTILTDNEHADLTRDGIEIRVRPLWYYALLSNSG